MDICPKSPSSSTASRRPSSSSTASCRTRITASRSRFSTSPRISASRSSTPAAAAAPAPPATSSSARAQQHLSEMQDDEADRLDTAWGLTAGVAPRLPGRHQRRRRLRAADVHAQLRAGRRRHSARQVGPEGTEGGGGQAVKWTDAEDIGIALVEKFPERRSADGALHRPARARARARRLRRRSEDVERAEARSDSDGVARGVQGRAVLVCMCAGM